MRSLSYFGDIHLTFPAITLRALWRRRKDLHDLPSLGISFPYPRYLRLILLCAIDVVCTVPLALYVLISDATSPIYPWKGFADLHLRFTRVRQYPSAIWIRDDGTRSDFEVNEWLAIGSAILHFLLFGLTEGARRQYIAVFNSVASKLGIPGVTTVDTRTR